MNMLNLKNDFNLDRKLEKIWNSRYNNEKEVISALYPEGLRKNTITFLGLNPSLPPKYKEKAKRGFYPALPYPMIDYEKEKANHPFFQKFYDLGENFKSWTVLDLLYEQESTQSELERRYNKKTISKKDEKFIQDQIRLTFKILEKLEPKVVVVSSAGSDRFIHEHLEKLGLKQILPTESNNFVYRINDIPFITIESRFLGSRFHRHNEERRKNLTNEIKRVLSAK